MTYLGLRELQIAMQRHLLGNEDAKLERLVVDAPPLPVTQRVAIYKNGYRTRLIDALADTHPILRQVLGDVDFAEAAGGFIDSQPSMHRSIRWYGRELSRYLARCAPFDAQPIFGELAGFEWTLAEVFDAPDMPHVERDALQNIAPEKWSTLRFEFHPALRQTSLNWNTVAVWRAMSREETPPDPQLQETARWLLWRQDFKSNFRSLDVDEWAALNAALRGENFAAVCATLAPHHADEHIPLRVATLIAGWIDSCMVTAITG